MHYSSGTKIDVRRTVALENQNIFTGVKEYICERFHRLSSERLVITRQSLRNGVVGQMQMISGCPLAQNMCSDYIGPYYSDTLFCTL